MGAKNRSSCCWAFCPLPHVLHFASLPAAASRSFFFGSTKDMSQSTEGEGVNENPTEFNVTALGPCKVVRADDGDGTKCEFSSVWKDSKQPHVCVVWVRHWGCVMMARILLAASEQSCAAPN